MTAPRIRVGAASAPPPDVDRVLATDADERVRVLLARKLAALSGTLLEPDRERLSRQARVMLAHLVEDEAERVRAAIADVVKQMPNAPRELILRLARDTAVTVSDPVIRLSPLLTAEDLLALLAAAPSPTIALSVARRFQHAGRRAVAGAAGPAAAGADPAPGAGLHVPAGGRGDALAARFPEPDGQMTVVWPQSGARSSSRLIRSSAV
jgi:hypothetical protein